MWGALLLRPAGRERTERRRRRVTWRCYGSLVWGGGRRLAGFGSERAGRKVACAPSGRLLSLSPSPLSKKKKKRKKMIFLFRGRSFEEPGRERECRRRQDLRVASGWLILMDGARHIILLGKGKEKKPGNRLTGRQCGLWIRLPSSPPPLLTGRSRVGIDESIRPQKNVSRSQLPTSGPRGPGLVPGALNSKPRPGCPASYRARNSLAPAGRPGYRRRLRASNTSGRACACTFQALRNNPSPEPASRWLAAGGGYVGCPDN